MELDPGVHGGLRHRIGDRAHASFGEPDALDRVHVGDDGVQRQRLGGREAGVHRLEAEDAVEARVGEAAFDGGTEAFEAAQRDQAGGRDRVAQQVGRAVEVHVDEVGQFSQVQLAQPDDELLVGGGVDRPALAGDLGAHRLHSVAHVQGGAVVEARTVGRVEQLHRQVVVRAATHRTEGLVEQVHHGEHGRAGVEGEPVALDAAAPPPGTAARSSTVTW